MKQTFTILWVEDKPKALRGQKKKIEEFLKEMDFEPKIIFDENGERIEEILKSENIDIVVADINISEKFSGIDVIKLIRRGGFLTDILFYSAIGFDKEEILKQTDHYGFAEIVEGKDIEEPLKKLVDKNIRRCQDIVFLRGKVITSVIDLELRINEFFVEYFKIPDETQEQFHNFILENRYTSLGGKALTLKTITEKNGVEKNYRKWIQEIQELGNERNLLAHCKTDPDKKNILISMGRPKEFNKEDIHEILKKIKRVLEGLDDLKSKLI